MSEIPEKLFYKVGEVCKYTDTQPYVLRFWESEFPQLAAQKNRAGQRVYTRDDLQIVLQIKKLLYEQEYTIADARRALGTAPELASAPAMLQDSTAAEPEDGELWTDVLPEIGSPDAASQLDFASEQEAKPAESRVSLAEAGALRARLETLEERCRSAEDALAASQAESYALRARAERVAARLERLLATLPRAADGSRG